MSEKIKRTTFGVMTSHVVSSSALFPLLWLVIGSIGKAMLLQESLINETVANIIYYAGMMLFFYFGIKYSLYYINKKVFVTLPKQSGQQSIILFALLVVAVNYGLFYFEETINIMRILFSFMLVYMFTVITKKYFDSLEETENMECTFIGQIIVLLANLSIFVSMFALYGILDTIWTQELHLSSHILSTVIAGLIAFLSYKRNIVNKIFVPFFYKEDEEKPIKYALVTLAITLPLNIGLYFVVINYFEKFVI